jgi:ParB/RepB/Spo0J family partition protein
MHKQEKRLVSDIKIGPRFRKNLGDIEGLANAIKDTGCLLQPIGINQDNELVYGVRRLEACKHLGWTEIPVTIVQISDMIKGEFYENAARKDFVFSERMAIFEEIERSKLERKGQRSAEIAAKSTGSSASQLYKEKKLWLEIRSKPRYSYLIKKLDEGEITVNHAIEIIWEAEHEIIGLDEPIMKSDGFEVSKEDRLRQILHDKLIELANDTNILIDRIMNKNYISDNPTTVLEYIFGVESLRALIHPEKYSEKNRKKLLKWVDELESFYERHSNVFASNVSPALDSVNTKTGQIEIRKLDREEAEDWHRQIIKEFRGLIKRCPLVLGMNKNFNEKERGYRAKRRHLLHDRLSEAA